jgi:hypothetical protein
MRRYILTDLQSLPPLPGERDRAGEVLAKVGGFSLHAGVAAEAHQRRSYPARE